MKDIADLSALSAPGSEIAVRVTPNASRARLTADGDEIRAYVTVVPEGGKANKAVIALLSKALKVPKGRITLKRGATSRDKLFVIDP